MPRRLIGSAESLLDARLGAGACGIGEHADDQQTSERVGERGRRLPRILVEAGDGDRWPARGALGVPDERRWLLVQARGLEQRSSYVGDDRPPLVRGVAVGEAVELERPVTALRGVGGVGLGGGEKLPSELVLSAVWQRM